MKDDETPGRVSAGVKRDRLTRHLKSECMLFLAESLERPSGARRKRLYELTTLLLSRAIKSGGEGDASVEELATEIEELRASFDPGTARFGA